MRLRAIAFGSSILFAAIAIACSAKQPDATSEDDDTKTPDRQDSGGAPATTDPPVTNNDTPPDLDASAADAEPDGGTILTSGDGGKSCTGASVAEAEPNNTAATANVLPNVSGSLCGRLTTKTDVDFATFTMPADKTYLFTGYALTGNNVTITVTVDGESFKAGSAPIVKPGSKYTIQAVSTNDKEVDYRFEYKFEQ